LLHVKRLLPSDVSLRLASPWSETALACSAIIADGRDTGQVVAGEILEAAIEWSHHRLLFVTDNIPFEDHLRIYLFDTQWKIVDAATLGAMYSTGVFSGLELQPPASLRFRFFGGITWTLELLDHPVASLPFSNPTGVHRPFNLFKRFKIRGRPYPNMGA